VKEYLVVLRGSSNSVKVISTIENIIVALEINLRRKLNDEEIISLLNLMGK